MPEQRTLKPEDVGEVFDTTSVVPSYAIIREVDEKVQSGYFYIVDGHVFIRDPLMRMQGLHMLEDDPEIDLSTGVFIMHNGLYPVQVPINPEPLAYLRQLAGWSPPTMPLIAA